MGLVIRESLDVKRHLMDDVLAFDKYRMNPFTTEIALNTLSRIDEKFSSEMSFSSCATVR
jgi:hypothetical protein